MSKTADDVGKVGRWGTFLGAVLFVAAVYVAVSFVVAWYIPKIETRGQFGDSFGVINALFSGLAFAGVIWAIILQREQLAAQNKELALQREELKLQREELAETRKEIKGQKEQLALQREELAEQNQTLQKQNFESSFFQLLGLHNDIVNTMISREHPDKIYQGRECFFIQLRSFHSIYVRKIENDRYARMNPNKAKQLMLQDINERYEEFFTHYQSQVGHYFRNLYNAVKFVDQSDFLDKDAKKRYTNLIRAQLSSDELGLLFYNCLSGQGANFKDFVEKYALLEDMDFKELFNEEHRTLYDKSAYGESDGAV